MKKNIFKTTTLFVSVLLGCALLSGCEEPPVAEKRLRPVKSMTVQAGDGELRQRVFSGTTQSSEEADLSFKVQGSVKRVAVDVGDIVKRGDVIAELDPATYQVELEQAIASTAKSNASRRSAESEYQRVRLLYTNDNASQNELDNALANAESAKAAYNADMQSERLTQLNLDYTRLQVDANCTVAAVNIEANENVSAGQTVAEVSCGNNWEIQISVPESLIALFKRDMPASVQFAYLANQDFTAQVTEVGIGTRSSSTYPVTLSLNESPANIRSNLAAEVSIQFANGGNEDSTAFYLPASAVVKDQSGTFVYMMQASDQSGAAILQKQLVEVGEISALGVEIKSGLTAGDRIVVAGQINARVGMLVRDQ